jgi:hypothetical protein
MLTTKIYILNFKTSNLEILNLGNKYLNNDKEKDKVLKYLINHYNIDDINYMVITSRNFNIKEKNIEL